MSEEIKQVPVIPKRPNRPKKVSLESVKLEDHEVKREEPKKQEPKPEVKEEEAQQDELEPASSLPVEESGESEDASKLVEEVSGGLEVAEPKEEAVESSEAPIAEIVSEEEVVKEQVPVELKKVSSRAGSDVSIASVASAGSKKTAPVVPKRLTPSSTVSSFDSDSDVSSKHRPVVPSRPSKSGESKELPTVPKKKAPAVPKKPSSKILAFQNLLNQQQQAQFSPKPPSRRGSEISNSEDNEDGGEVVKKLSRHEFGKNLNGMIGFALPGMGPPGLPGRLSRSTTEEDLKEEPEDNKEGKLVDVRRGRARGVKGRRLPKSVTEKVEVGSKKLEIYVADVWETKVRRVKAAQEAPAEPVESEDDYEQERLEKQEEAEKEELFDDVAAEEVVPAGTEEPVQLTEPNLIQTE